MSLEVYADPELPVGRIEALNALVERAWPFFLMLADRDNLYESFVLNVRRKVLEVELVWTRNDAMRAVNWEYRQKDMPTDVLSFTLLADADDPELWMSLPVLQLGTIFVSVEYAEEALTTVSPDDPAAWLDRYLLERVIHGMLHLLGMHHDTMEKYEKVVSIQHQVLDAVFSEDR